MTSRFLLPISLASIVFFCGFSSAPAKPSKVAHALLDAAINSTDTKNTSCLATEYSTEDENILDVVRSRRFSILSHEVHSDEDGTYHQFILSAVGSKIQIDAIVYVSNERCSKYSFGRIVD